MKKIILLILIALMVHGVAESYNCTAKVGGVDTNWSTAGNWDNCNSTYPQSGDSVDLLNVALTWDAGATTIPASGSLASFGTSGNYTGSLTLANAICTSGCALNVTGNITMGKKPAGNALIDISGSSAYNITITANTITAGGDTNAKAIYSTVSSGSSTLTVTAAILGGAGTNAHAVELTSAQNVSVTGTLTGGAGTSAYGLAKDAGSGNVTIDCGGGAITGGPGNQAVGFNGYNNQNVTLTNCNLIDGAMGKAYYGDTPKSYNPTCSNYIKVYIGSGGPTTANTLFYKSGCGAGGSYGF